MNFNTSKIRNNKMKLATLSLLTITALANTGIIVSADSVTPDTSSIRQVTIHALNGVKKTSNALGNNDGSVLDTSSSKALANVGFSAIKVNPASGYTAATMVATDSSTYTTSGKAVSSTTDAKGTAILSIGTGNTSDGYYLVTQTTSSDGINGTDPFIVQVPLNSNGTTPDGTWTYNVNVYPKLSVDAYTNPDKTIDLNDGTGTDKQSSTFAGQNVTWNLATNFPASMRIKNSDATFTYGTAEFKDQLDTINLTYQSISFSTALQDTKTNAFTQIKQVALTATTDYSLTTDEGLVDLKLTNSGIDKVLAALPPVTTGTTAMFIPNITTKISATFTAGQIGNSFIPGLTNAYGINLNPTSAPSNPGTPTTPGGNTTPDLYLGALSLKKVDSVSGTALQGATFGIATTLDKAKAGDFIQKDNDGVLYADKKSVPAGVSTKDYKQVTDGTGQATFVGLKLQDNNKVSQVADANTTYYVTETEAPTGYNKANTPFSVTAGITSPTNQLSNNLNGGNIKLPFTGGQGMVGLLVIASVAAGASIVIRRRRTSDQD